MNVTRVTERELTVFLVENQERFYRLAYSYLKDREEALDAVKNALARLEREGQGEKIEGTRWTIFKQQCCFLGNCQALGKLNWDVSRFRCPEWDGVAESIAKAIKSKELDAAYLERKNA